MSSQRKYRSTNNANDECSTNDAKKEEIGNMFLRGMQGGYVPRIVWRGSMKLASGKRGMTVGAA